MSPRVGLVLGAGGETGGAFHTGVLNALSRVLGWHASSVDIIIGTSAGSIAGASLRAGLTPQDMYNRCTRQPLSASGQRILDLVPPTERDDPELGARPCGPQAPALLRAFRPGSMKVGVLAAAALPEGTVPTSGISRAIRAISGNTWPDDPLWVVATQLSDGQRVVFGRDSQGSIGDCVAASCAIPGYFRPVVINGTRHVDGGMYSACNLDLLAGSELDLVIVSSPMSVDPMFAKTADWPFRQFLRRQLQKEAALVRKSGANVVIFAPTRDDLQVMGVNPMAPGREAAVARQVLASITERISAEPLLARL